MPADTDALNYPYIRVRSADWLKRTLLIFPHVARMTPFDNAPADDPEVEAFCWQRGRRGPLLRPADLHAPHVERAQRELMHGLHDLQAEIGPRRFNALKKWRDTRASLEPGLTIWEQRLGRGRQSFQIHGEKVLHELSHFLLHHGLAWLPEDGHGHGPSYIEMHPMLGEAVMATLAMACAENEGLQVVTEFPRLHGKLLGVPREDILNATFRPVTGKGPTSSRQIAEVLVYRRCEVEALTAERIAALKSERDALADFRAKLEDLAATLPPTIHDEARLEERLNDLLNDMFQDWRRDQANLSAYSRKLFGEGALAEPGKLVQKLVEDAMKPGGGTTAVGAAAGVATHHASIGGLTLGSAAGAAAGFAVAVVFRAVSAWGETKKAASDSPFRYLTTLQDQGVSFCLTR